MVHSIRVGARPSPLSKAQIQEIQELLPDIQLEPMFVQTTGDRDQSRSLREMDKSNFFTKELDDLVLSGECAIAVHSAKDLPEPIPKELKVVAITQGIDSRDMLILPPNDTLDALPKGALIGTSTKRREDAVNQLRSDLTFAEIRGTIAERLQQLARGDYAAIVMAEAAILRLKLTHLNRIPLPGKTAPLQGKLAIVARSDDAPTASFFERLDSRRTHLYLGLNPQKGDDILHFPVIKTIPLPKPTIDLTPTTHIIFTSKTAVKIFTEYFGKKWHHQTLIAVGPATAHCIEEIGLPKPLVAEETTAEGIIALLKTLDLTRAHILWPHSALSRPHIGNYLSENQIPHTTFPLYTTLFQKPFSLPTLSHLKTITFTSPSTVDAFFAIYPDIPPHITLNPTGPITAQRLSESVAYIDTIH